MSRVGKSATKTEAETRESDLISVLQLRLEEPDAASGSHVSIIVSSSADGFSSQQSPEVFTLPQEHSGGGGGGVLCSPLRKSLLSHFSRHGAAAGPLNASIYPTGGLLVRGHPAIVAFRSGADTNG